MREILFRGKSEGDWCEGSLVYFPKENQYYISEHCDEELFFPVDEETVGQFTGLYDSTKWEDLTESEKEQFYRKHNSEDGVTIKYPTVESVKQLWKGKRIFEGDILSVKVREIIKECGIRKFTGKMKKTVWSVEYAERHSQGNGFFVFGKDRRFSLGLTKSVIYNANPEIIGNIHDNPELMEVR